MIVLYFAFFPVSWYKIYKISKNQTHVYGEEKAVGLYKPLSSALDDKALTDKEIQLFKLENIK